MLPQRRRSSAKIGAVDAQPQNQNETDNKAEDEATYDTEQSAYDETGDEVELLSPESSDDDVHERSVFGNDTGSEFERIADDEDTMDYTSVQDEHESTGVGINTKSEGVTDDEDSMLLFRLSRSRGEAEALSPKVQMTLLTLICRIVTKKR